MMSFPLFIGEPMDFSFYDSVEAAVSDFEPWIVKDIGVIGYDAAGRLLRIQAFGVEEGRFLFMQTVGGGHIEISCAEENPEHAGELESWLRKFLVARKISSEAIPAGDLSALIQKARY